MLVQEAGHLLLECACLQQLSHGTGIVEKLPLQLRRKRVPLHDNRRAEAPKNVPFFLGQGEGIRRILRMNRLVRIVRNPTSVISKLGERRSSLWDSRISSGLSVPLINSEYSSARARYCLGVNIWSPCCNEYLSCPLHRDGGCSSGAPDASRARRRSKAPPFPDLRMLRATE
jgi:hypothetical protein